MIPQSMDDSSLALRSSVLFRAIVSCLTHILWLFFKGSRRNPADKEYSYQYEYVLFFISVLNNCFVVIAPPFCWLNQLRAIAWFSDYNETYEIGRSQYTYGLNATALIKLFCLLN